MTETTHVPPMPQPGLVTNARLTADGQPDTSGLVVAGWLLAVLIPLVGFALVLKGRHGHGTMQMVLATLVPVILMGLILGDVFGGDEIDLSDLDDGSTFDETSYQTYDECMSDPTTTASQCEELRP